MTIEKRFLTANDLLADSYRLANAIFDDGYQPTHIVGLWRGGAPVGIAVQELLDYRGVPTDHIAIRTASYEGIDLARREVRVFSLGYLVDTLVPEHRLLVIDDVFDSGRSIEAFLHELAWRCRYNMPATIRIATVYYKPERVETALRPDYWVHETDEWLVFPHEVHGLTDEEIRRYKPEAALILRDT